MIYLDNAATTLQKPPEVAGAVYRAIGSCASPGRGTHPPAMRAADTVYACREAAARLFHASPEQVVFTMNATHGLNIAVRSLVSPGDRVVVSGYEHNAVLWPLYAAGAQVDVAESPLFSSSGVLEAFQKHLAGCWRCFAPTCPMSLASGSRWRNWRRCAGQRECPSSWTRPRVPGCWT